MFNNKSRLSFFFIFILGRFGNQADQFLGALAFANELKRTLVLPHWIEYPEGSPTSVSLFIYLFFF